MGDPNDEENWALTTDKIEQVLADVRKTPCPRSACCMDDVDRVRFALHIIAEKTLAELLKHRAESAAARANLAAVGVTEDGPIDQLVCTLSGLYLELQQEAGTAQAASAPHVNAELATIGPLMTQAEAEQLRAERAAERVSQERHDLICGDYADSLRRIGAERDEARERAHRAEARVAELEAEISASEEPRDIYRDRCQQLASRIAELDAETARMRGVVTAAERWFDDGPVCAGIAEAVKAYRAGRTPPATSVDSDPDHFIT